MNKILLAHSGLQHSLRTAEALHKHGYSYKFMTTVYNKTGLWSFIIKKIFPKNVIHKLNKRRSKDIPDNNVIMTKTFWGLVYLAIYKLPISRKYINRIYCHMNDVFGKKVANYAIKYKFDAVIMYDTTSNVCFNILKQKAPHIKRILDVSIANPFFIKHNFIQDIRETGDDSLKKEQIKLWDEKYMKRCNEEMKLSQYFIVASNMSKRSLMFSNINPSMISIIPYGVNSKIFQYKNKEINNEKLRLIYVGRINYRKGLHHLLKVIKERFKADEIDITLVGYCSPNNPFLQKYGNIPNIRFAGFVDHNTLASFYRNSDVFVFPTLGEGYGLVILEALSCGLPCIVSDLAGGDDAIQNGQNGFVFKAGDDNELYEKINWFLKHREELPILSKNSKESSQYFTWERYYDNLHIALQRILNE